MAASDKTSNVSSTGRGTASATIVLRRRASISSFSRATAPLTSSALGARVGAHPDDVRVVREAALTAGLRVISEHLASRRVRVQGPADIVAAWVAKTPDALAGVVTAILGGSSPQAFPRFVMTNPQAVSASYTPLQLAAIYAMPQASGSGETIALIELGGGFGKADLDAYFSALGLATPSVQAIGVDGATNVPGQDPNGADGEVLLDIEIAGAIAPEANFLVYFAPNTDAGFLDAVSTAAHANPAPSAISISWGQSEDQWRAEARRAIDDACADAVAMGVTVIAAAGDNGSSGGGTPGTGPHADFPASSPHVLGCGGTSLRASGTAVLSETVWNDGGQGGATGGGVSDVFALPSWQQAAGVPERANGGAGRGVPDVAANADPMTGYQVLVDGVQTVAGGTSAVAPLWAGLIARIAELSGAKMGLVQVALYKGVSPNQAAPHLRDITSGGNGAYRAGPGWDPCTGLGVPDGATAKAFTPAIS